MSTGDFILAPPPASERRRELWIQHAVGFILFEDVRGWAMQRLDPNLDATAKAAALKAINDTVYGLMMVLDGVSGSLRNSEYSVHLQTKACLTPAGSDEVTYALDLQDSDGFCMAYHAWLEGDFGDDPVFVS
jgi:ligand-binding sensor domain-containing protein